MSFTHGLADNTYLTYAYAYSVGCLQSNGDDFKTNAIAAANIFGTISNFYSYYNDEPTYSYLNGNNPKSIKRIASEIVFLNAHANATLMHFEHGGTNCYVTANYSSSSNSAVGLKSVDMSTCSLICFVGCSTGSTAGGYISLPDIAVSRGAATAIGFTNEISSRSWSGKNWLSVFENRIAAGYTVSNAVTAAVQAYPSSNLSTYVRIVGFMGNIPALAGSSSGGGGEIISSTGGENDEYTETNEIGVIQEEGNSFRNSALSNDVLSFLEENIEGFEKENYSVDYISYGKNDRIDLGKACYQIGGGDITVQTNAGVFLEYTDDKFVRVTVNGAHKHINEIDEARILDAVNDYMKTPEFCIAEKKAKNYEQSTSGFYFDYISGKLTYSAYAWETVAVETGDFVTNEVCIAENNVNWN